MSLLAINEGANKFEEEQINASSYTIMPTIIPKLSQLTGKPAHLEHV
jgi:hypothetical protein